MEPLHRFLIVSSLASLGLSACSMEPREGPPAPIVQVTPRDGQPARPVAPTPQPERASVPEQPSQPVRRGTQVYAYRDPSTVAEPTAPPAATVPQTVPAATPPASGIQPAQPVTQTPSAPPTPGSQAQPITQTPGTPPTSGRPTAPAPSTPERPTTPPQRSAEQQVAKVDPRATLPAAETPSAERPVAPAPALPPSNFAAPSLPPAAAKLAGQAEQQRQAGDFAGAAASLERSLRIAPREAYLWNRLARVRLEQGQAVQAGNLASRANDLAGEKQDIKRDNWRIIAESKRRSGDLAGAGEAEQRAGGQ